MIVNVKFPECVLEAEDVCLLELGIFPKDRLATWLLRRLRIENILQEIPLKFNDIHDQILYGMESSKLKVQKKSCLDGGVERRSRGNPDLKEAAGSRELKTGRAA